eukprot:1148432-Pleurochrysis_carterae.AAC.1
MYSTTRTHTARRAPSKCLQHKKELHNSSNVKSGLLTRFGDDALLSALSGRYLGRASKEAALQKNRSQSDMNAGRRQTAGSLPYGHLVQSLCGPRTQVLVCLLQPFGRHLDIVSSLGATAVALMLHSRASPGSSSFAPPPTLLSPDQPSLCHSAGNG